MFVAAKTKPVNILKPCYWVGKGGEAHLIKPRPGYVHRMSRAGLRPGGMVGAGEKTLAYFLISRPVAKIKQPLVRLGISSGFGNDFSAWGREEDFARIKAAHLKNLLSLSAEAGARLLLIDPGEVYRPYIIGNDDEKRLIYVGAAEWKAAVDNPMSRMPKALARVPGDGHYGPGAHRLIAALISAKLLSVN